MTNTVAEDYELKKTSKKYLNLSLTEKIQAGLLTKSQKVTTHSRAETLFEKKMLELLFAYESLYNMLC